MPIWTAPHSHHSKLRAPCTKIDRLQCKEQLVFSALFASLRCSGNRLTVHYVLHRGAAGLPPYEETVQDSTFGTVVTEVTHIPVDPGQVSDTGFCSTEA